MKSTLWGLFLTLSVGVQAQEENHFRIIGSFNNMDEALVYLSYKGIDGPVWDSSEVKDRGYVFEGNAAAPGTVARLFVLYKDAETGEAKSKEADLFLDTCTIYVNHTDSFSNTSFSGSEINVEFGKLRKAVAPFDARLDSVERLFKDAAKREDVKGMVAAHQLILDIEVAKSEQVYARYLVENPTSPAAFYALSHYGTEDSTDYTRLRFLFDRMPETLRQSQWGQGFGQSLASAARIAIGNSAMDFVLNDTSGRPIKLSSYRGSYVLLDFWASWCVPCRQENPNLLKAYAKYHSQGLDILGVSLDNNRGKWLDAIREDHLPWKQVSDLSRQKNQAALRYEVQFIPRNFLIDPQGKIVAKDLIEQDLIEQLEMIFGE
jgi:peroxiredoxin